MEDTRDNGGRLVDGSGKQYYWYVQSRTAARDALARDLALLLH